MTRVAVTGIGVVSPLGLDAAVDLGGGARGAERRSTGSRSFDTEGLPVRIAGEVKGFDPISGRLGEGRAQARAQRPLRALGGPGGARRRRARRVRPDPGRDPVRLGDRRHHRHLRAGRDPARRAAPTASRPSFLPNVLVDTASGQLAISLGIKGFNYAIVSACATGSHAIGEAAELIKRGDADAVIAGGTEACVDPLILAGFTAMRGPRRRGRAPAARLAARSTRPGPAS